MRLAGQTAIVTGGASGFGAGIARKFVAEGAQVVLADLNIALARELAAELGEAALPVAADVADGASVAAMVAACQERFGAVDILVNNAGVTHLPTPLEEVSEADFDRVFAVNCKSVYLTARAVVPLMKAAGSGVIVNIASQLGQIGGVELVHYSAAKAGIIGLTKALAREVSARGVRVNAVAPGPINTELVMALSDDWRAAKAAELPLGRFGEPEDVAATVAFLASEDAKIYVGQTLGPNSGDVMV